MHSKEVQRPQSVNANAAVRLEGDSEDSPPYLARLAETAAAAASPGRVAAP